MGKLNRDEVHVQVDGIQPYQNDKYAGIKLLWSGNIGFGEYEIYSKNSDREPMYDDCPEDEYMYINWAGQSECMDSQDDKWFIKLLLESLVNKMRIEE